MKIVKKAFKKLFLFLVGIFLVFIAYSAITSSPRYIFRIIKNGNSDVLDYKIFPSRTIKHSDNPYHYNIRLVPDFENTPISYRFNNKPIKKQLGQILKETKTTSLIVVHNDAVVYEYYGNGYDQESVNTSFSAVKSIVSILIGIAIEEGSIISENQSIADYLPEYKNTPFEKITIKDLLEMRSPIKYTEDNIWFGDDAKTYYMPDLRNLALHHLTIDKDYRGNFHYNNYHPLLLGIILERSTGKKVSQYFEEKIWNKVGAEYDASWSLDSEKDSFEKMESGLNFRSIDFAKIGSMLLHNGTWNGENVIGQDWINKATVAKFPLNKKEYKNSFLDESGTGYKYMWYSVKNKQAGIDYYAAGKYSQYLFVSPKNNVVIVRNGIENGEIDWWSDILQEITNEVL